MILVRDIKEIAAHAASRAAPYVTYHPVAPAAESPMRPPIFLHGAPGADLLLDIYCATATPAVGCYDIDDAMVAPTGIAIKGGVAFCATDAFIHPRHHVVSVSDRLNAASLPVRHVAGRLAVLCGPAHETWGHWLVDFLPRLWVLHAAGHDLEKLRYLVPADLGGFAVELLHLCGVRPHQLERYRHWHEVIACDSLLMPTGLRAGNRLAPCFAVATQFWSQLVAPAAGGGHRAPCVSLYVSRGGAGQARALANREEIETIAAAAGLRIVRPEQLGIVEQIGLFRRAAVICGEYGSALHNSVFSPRGTCVCGLRGTALHPGFVQSGIATALGQDVGYVFGHTEGQDARQSFRIVPADFEAALRLMDIRRQEKTGLLF